MPPSPRSIACSKAAGSASIASPIASGECRRVRLLRGRAKGAGRPLCESSILYAEQYHHGRPHKLKFRVTKVVPNELISCRPLFPSSMLAAGSQFMFEPRIADRCAFIADGQIQFPLWLFKRMHKQHEGKLAASKKHMKRKERTSSGPRKKAQRDSERIERGVSGASNATLLAGCC